MYLLLIYVMTKWHGVRIVDMEKISIELQSLIDVQENPFVLMTLTIKLLRLTKPTACPMV